MTTSCDYCGRETPNRRLCSSCMRHEREVLGDDADIVDVIDLLVPDIDRDEVIRREVRRVLRHATETEVT